MKSFNEHESIATLHFAMISRFLESRITADTVPKVPVMHFCTCPIHYKVDWRVSKRLGACRLISTQL